MFHLSWKPPRFYERRCPKKLWTKSFLQFYKNFAPLTPNLISSVCNKISCELPAKAERLTYFSNQIFFCYSEALPNEKYDVLFETPEYLEFYEAAVIIDQRKSFRVQSIHDRSMINKNRHGVRIKPRDAMNIPLKNIKFPETYINNICLLYHHIKS